MERVQEFGLKSWEGLSSRLAFLGFCIWSLAIPFAQIQKVRFTAIAIFIIIGAFLIFIPGKSSFRRIRKRVAPFLIIFFLIGILPILDFWRWENQKLAMDSLVLRLPMLVIPFFLYQFSFYWPANWRIIVVLCLLLSTIVNICFFSAQGLELIYNSIRNNTDHIFVKFFVGRPYYGFLLGILFLSLMFICRHSFKFFLVSIFLIFNIFEYIILGKLFLLSSFLCSLVFYFYSIRNRTNILIGSVLFCVLAGGISVYRVIKTTAFLELQTLGQFDFSTVPKHYSNSINSRSILWKASKDLLEEDFNWIFGLGTQNFQDKLDAKVEKYNSYLTSQHLTSHNLFLGFWMQYGLLGIFLIASLFFYLFREAFLSRNIVSFMLCIFLFMSVQTEIYLDREMGVHLFIWVLVVVFFKSDSQLINELDKSQSV